MPCVSPYSYREITLGLNPCIMANGHATAALQSASGTHTQRCCTIALVCVASNPTDCCGVLALVISARAAPDSRCVWLLSKSAC